MQRHRPAKLKLERRGTLNMRLCVLVLLCSLVNLRFNDEDLRRQRTNLRR
ncbi:hypothetical protein GVAMD_0894 [Gardnerella vaginalis AMD]|nr:hypothetical protein GVAMD_0894 [Gardnerella vaginalis AMD]